MKEFNKNLQSLSQKYQDTHAVLMQINSEISDLVTPEIKRLLDAGQLKEAKLLIDNLPSCPTRMRMAGLYSQYEEKE